MESFKRFTEMEDKIKQLENELKWAIIVEMEAVSDVTIFLYFYHFRQILPPIEADIKSQRGRIPRNEGRAKTAQVWFC